jgi:hypothetical protein
VPEEGTSGSEGCTLVVGFAKQLWGAGAAIRLREGQAAGVARIIAGRAQRSRLMRVMRIRDVMSIDLIPALACPPHVICSIHPNCPVRAVCFSLRLFLCREEGRPASKSHGASSLLTGIP